ncbi:TadE/TadG family type IV pilus assembly protein [Rhizobium rhizogenes]|uniref:TadE/TadG family type IV pilus assembly protein n=1 Tax=Rhizobium rhizogenes TaxID=359 RepID=UPI0022BC2F13|nr:TadE/TadG family type IV pilus assembly protein [Rhizobium rhizogenes]MCZ7464038.1 TadE/TadG family type IV pilus assembly protein [Rhizobium rhizogenes]
MNDPKLQTEVRSPQSPHTGLPISCFRKFYPAFFADRQAAAAIEVALLLPVFLMFIFGILEVGLLLLYHLYLSTASSAGVEYLRKAMMQRQQITELDLRLAVASNFIVGTDAGNLKIALTPIQDEDIAAAPVSFPITNKFQAPTSSAGQYILAVGYTWDFFMPTTRFLVPTTGDIRQLKNISLAITAVRVTE